MLEKIINYIIDEIIDAKYRETTKRATKIVLTAGMAAGLFFNTGSYFWAYSRLNDGLSPDQIEIEVINERSYLAPGDLKNVIYSDLSYSIHKQEKYDRFVRLGVED